jgi:two-component system, NtrC family, response regulator AtoC
MKHVLLGNHPAIEKIRELITMVSDTAFNVLILGETGTGKEVVARLLHYASSRREKRFVKVNCAALPLNLLESELFGYEKGAFTGAVKAKPGKFELASGGVILLDEIGDMPLGLQSKMLHVLQSGEFNRLGGTNDVKVNSWVITATNHDLEKDMKEGRFREDLYYRLNIIKIELPPLSARRDDIPLLTDHFVREYRRELEIGNRFKLNSDFRSLFQSYHWPGNVRELANTILRLMIGDDSEKVRSEFLYNMKADGHSPPVELIPRPPDDVPDIGEKKDEPSKPKSLKELKARASRHIEKMAIIHALNKTAWNKRQAAKLLKISYKTLFYKMNDYGVARE